MRMMKQKVTEDESLWHRLEENDTIAQMEEILSFGWFLSWIRSIRKCYKWGVNDDEVFIVNWTI